MNGSGISVTVFAAAALVVAAPSFGQTGGGANPGKGARQGDMTEVRQRSEEMREVADRRAEKVRERAEAAEERGAMSEPDRDKALSGREHAELQGSDKAREMRNRRDERKAIMDEYKGDRKAQKDAMKAERKAGSELQAENSARMDADAAGEAPKKAKKPWWKFWGE